MTAQREYWRGRYGDNEGAAHLPVELHPVLRTLLGHRSVRAFTSEQLPEGTLETLVAAAQSAPSFSNLQVWSVIAVQDAGRRARLARLCGEQQHIAEAPLFLAWLVDLTRLSHIAAQSGREAEGLAYLDTFLMGVIDAALAAQNALAAVEALGLGSVYIGALRNQPEQVADELGIEPSVFPVFGMCVGRPDPARPAAVKPRLAQRAVLHRERYQRPSAEDIGAYDEVMQRFYTAQNMPVQRWSEHSAERVRSAAGLRGRDRLKEALQRLGFELR